ncbi:hypothetical protein MLD38_010023 [Melastoma candidum]|uniref:Uncharacterized protein n=1 Tax=Melastoma candidum TaxID=119954 RepID=A0ACB9QXR8_9MYRT|nr:hypothetical protein MLD38_010023 [Melastoma candidum]
MLFHYHGKISTGLARQLRYPEIGRSEELEISQPALDHNSTDIRHRMTEPSRLKKFDGEFHAVLSQIKRLALHCVS